MAQCDKVERGAFIESTSSSLPSSQSRMKTVLYTLKPVLLFVAGLLIGVGITLLSVRWHGTSGDVNYKTPAEGPLATAIEGLPPSDVDRQDLLEQFHQLKAMGCRATDQVLDAETLLSSKDELLDKDFYPKQIVLKRCSCAVYCPDSTKRCLPSKEKLKSFVFVYSDGERGPFARTESEGGRDLIERREFYEHYNCSCR